jgi:hypothetical protein
MPSVRLETASSTSERTRGCCAPPCCKARCTCAERSSRMHSCEHDRSSAQASRARVRARTLADQAALLGIYVEVVLVRLLLIVLLL